MRKLDHFLASCGVPFIRDANKILRAQIAPTDLNDNAWKARLYETEKKHSWRYPVVLSENKNSVFIAVCVGVFESNEIQYMQTRVVKMNDLYTEYKCYIMADGTFIVYASPSYDKVYSVLRGMLQSADGVCRTMLAGRGRIYGKPIERAAPKE